MEHCGASLQSVYRESIVGFCWVMCFVDFLTLKFRKVQQQEQQQQQQQQQQQTTTSRTRTRRTTTIR